MTSTTQSKKEIIDFLWEWAESKNTWGKLLVEKIVNKEAALFNSERQDIFEYFLDTLRKTPKMPVLTIVKPVFVATTKNIVLTSLSAVSGVNRLAKDQLLEFGKNISIIYGENGTGKTGYGRVLKSQGFSYDLQNNVHHNIFGSVEAKSAIIEYNVGNIPSTFTWTGHNIDPELANISVFNNNCVQISLTDRKLIVSPMGFHLFSIVTNELVELAKLFQNKVQSFSTEVLCSGALHQDTPQYSFITGLSHLSTEQKLMELATVNNDIDILIDQKEKEFLGLNYELISVKIINLKSQIADIIIVIGKINSTQQGFSATQWKEKFELNQSIKLLGDETKVGLGDIVNEKGITLYDTDEFKNFITSAENYIRLLDRKYPEQQDNCVYCQQPLDEDGLKLIKAYRTLLNDDRDAKLKELKEKNEAAKKLSLTFKTNLLLNQPSFGSDEHSQPIQPIELSGYNTKLNLAITEYNDDSKVTQRDFDVVYTNVLSILGQKKAELESQLLENLEKLNSLKDSSTKLQSIINELKDRKVLSINLSDIKIIIANKKQVHLLNTKYNDFSTNSISRKTTEAREELISQNFNNVFQRELTALSKSHLKIDLNFGTDRGNSKITQKINQYTLTDILSEGEQKAIALAEFLTELQLDNTCAPIVFDDPVNSLDHKIIDEVSKRLIELSKTRQVIVFTHSILLLNSFIQQSELDTNKQAGIGFKFHSVHNNYGETGILGEVEELNSLSYYIKKLNNVLNSKNSTMAEEELARKGYGHLRSAIEVFVEGTMLRGTIKRYRKGVAFPSLLRVEGAKLDLLKGGLNDVYEKCCICIDGHSSPSEIHVTPTIVGLKADYDLYTNIKSQYS